MSYRLMRTAILIVSSLAIIPAVADATIHTITMSGTSYSPKGTIVHWGDTVRWSNSSGFHTSSSDAGSPKTWDSGTTTSGDSFDVIFKQADGLGPFPYHCNFHVSLGMKDTIHVAPPPCCTGLRGNVNCSGIIDLVDLATLVRYLTIGDITLCCTNSANVDGAGIVDLADLSALVSYLTGGGFVPGNCP